MAGFYPLHIPPSPPRAEIAAAEAASRRFKRDLEIALGKNPPHFWHSGIAIEKDLINKPALKASTAYYRAP